MKHTFHVIAIFVWALLAAGCGGGGGGGVENVQASYVISESVSFIPQQSVISVRPDDLNAARQIAQVSATGFRAGQVVAIPQPRGSNELFPVVGKINAISDLNGTRSLTLEPVQLNEIYKELKVDVDTRRDEFKILRVATAGQTGTASAQALTTGPSQKQSVQVNYVSESTNTDSNGLNLKRGFEIPLAGNKKLSATLNIEKLRTSKVLQLRSGCAFAGCTLNDVGAYDEVAHSVSGDWSFDISLEGEQNVKGLNGQDLSLTSIIDTTQMWKNLKRNLGVLTLTGLDGSDKQGLIPLFGVVLASSSLPPLTPITVNDGLLSAASGPTVILIVYIKLDGSVKLKGTFTPLSASGKINQSISLKPSSDQGELAGTTQGSDESPTKLASRLDGALEARASVGVAVSTELIIGGVRPLSVTSELLAVEETRSLIGTAEITWAPQAALAGYYCVKGQTRWYSSIGIAGALGVGLKTIDGQSVFQDKVGFSWKRELNWSKVPSGRNACSAVNKPVMTIAEMGDGSGVQSGKKALAFNYGASNATLKGLADSWIVSVISPGPRSLVTEPQLGQAESVMGYVDAGQEHRFAVSAYSNTFGEIAISDEMVFRTSPLNQPFAPVTVSGLTASQSAPGAPVDGFFLVAGTDVTSIRILVRTLNSATPVPKCWINLGPTLGPVAFAFQGDWGGEVGACEALMPARGTPTVLEFLIQVADSKGNRAEVCSAPSLGGPGECTIPVISVPVLASPLVTSVLRVPDTGVTSAQCFDDGVTSLVACSSAAALAASDTQDGMLTPGAAGMVYSAVANYPVTDCVKDDITALVWEGKTITGPRAGTNTYTNFDLRYWGNATEVNAGTNAIGYVNYVNGSALCGYSDWRLPNAAELQELNDYGHASPTPAINQVWFPNTQSQFYWTSSRIAASVGLSLNTGGNYIAYQVDFAAGGVGDADRGVRNRSFPVRLVRGQARGSPAYSISADGSEVTEAKTGLVWQRCSQGQLWSNGTCTGNILLMKQDQALTYAKQKPGWRLPNVKELLTLIDYSAENPGLNSSVFPTPAGTRFWTSTPITGRAELAEAVLLTDGFSGPQYRRNADYAVRLVRQLQ